MRCWAKEHDPSEVAFSALLPRDVTVAPGLYRVTAAGVLSLHAAYIAWVIFGAFFTRDRPRLATPHVATLVYGMIIEIFGFWCPLTALETWLEVRGGVSPYRGPFLLHYLDAVVYPDIPPNLLIAGAVAVCIVNLWIYARRFRARRPTAFRTSTRSQPGKEESLAVPRFLWFKSSLVFKVRRMPIEESHKG